MAKRKGNKKAKTVTACGGTMDGVLAKGLAHPLRAEILAFLNDEQDLASPVEMFRAGVGAPGKIKATDNKDLLSSLCYHVSVLEDLGLIHEVDSRKVRGSVEHFYEATTRALLDLDVWAKLPPGAKTNVSIAAVEETLGRATKALSGGTFDTFDERAVINLPLRLDPEGFIQLAEDMTEFMAHCEKRQAEALERVKGDADKLMYTTASLLLYESPPPKGERKRGK